MKLTRLDLDGVGSPLAIAARIHALAPELPTAVPIEALCEQLDIIGIEDLATEGFEAALITDALKASGGILVANGQRPTRRRYSIAHELGHFLIPTHTPASAVGFECRLEDMFSLDTRTNARRLKMEAEANRFAAALLMPPSKLRRAMRRGAPEITEIVALADAFEVSKEAMARSWVEARDQAVAVVITENGCARRCYRNQRHFPWIDVQLGHPLPTGSLAGAHGLLPGAASDPEQFEPELWLGSRAGARVDILTEQVLAMSRGYAMVLLHAELSEQNHPDEEHDASSKTFKCSWRPR